MRPVGVEREPGPVPEHAREMKLGGVEAAGERGQGRPRGGLFGEDRLRRFDELVPVLFRAIAPTSAADAVERRGGIDRAGDRLVDELLRMERVGGVRRELAHGCVVQEVRVRIARPVPERKLAPARAEACRDHLRRCLDEDGVVAPAVVDGAAVRLLGVEERTWFGFASTAPEPSFSITTLVQGKTTWTASVTALTVRQRGSSGEQRKRPTTRSGVRRRIDIEHAILAR